MTEIETYNELLSMRAMAQMVVQNADRLIKELQPGSSARSRKIKQDYIDHKIRVRARGKNKKALATN